MGAQTFGFLMLVKAQSLFVPLLNMSLLIKIILANDTTVICRFELCIFYISIRARNESDFAS